ncbi:asparaginyl-tRNA synthetase-like protein [Trichodelitschia bisporula]|uniref:asparagine--tRNA ligase n=1 Tax=Trichodelitschia bisporula TaxID=703511 RepID=A0A6G1IAY0_9PEZI|nr:asparaginyl-tRNA synthetase-like protein [Trichodelitschia bisporula]
MAGKVGFGVCGLECEVVQVLAGVEEPQTFGGWLDSLRLIRHASSAIQIPRIASLLNPQAVDGSIHVNGFVRTIRKQRHVAFATITDGSSTEALQTILTPEQTKGVTLGSAVQIVGEWKPRPSRQDEYELHVRDLKILGEHDSTSYPIQKKFHTREFLRTLPHLRSRLKYNALLLRLRSDVISRVTSFFEELEFVQTHTPVITSSDCEGAGEVFAVESAAAVAKPSKTAATHPRPFFREPKYLTVSSQLHLEALALSVGRVWTLSPTFRAEKSETTRHLSEFYMLEAEVAFVGNVGDLMELLEAMLRAVVSKIQSSRLGEELLLARDDHDKDPENPEITRGELAARWDGITSEEKWPRITYARAITLLQEAERSNTTSFEYPPLVGHSLQAEHERYIAQTVGCGSPVFVTNYPRDIKAFYMAPSGESAGSDDIPTVACFDLLVPDVLELAGGSVREHRFDALMDSLVRHGLTESKEAGVPKNLQWYADLRRYGSVPHGGFGLGFDRLLTYLSGVPNVRDVVSFPRWHGRCDC